MNIPKSNPRSKSGRRLSDLPNLDTSTERKLNSSIKKLNEWLLKEAKIEMRSCDYSSTLLNAINLNNLSKADQDTINLMLFGEEENFIELNK